MDNLFRLIKTRGRQTSTRVAVLCVGFFCVQEVLAQIQMTKHNLTGTTVNMGGSASAIATICLSCHTPIGDESELSRSLWSRDATSAAFSTYNSLGTSGQVGPGAPVGSISLLCLSCHDGVQAMNVNINLGSKANASTRPENGSDHPVGIQYAGGALSEDGPPKSPGTYSNTLMRDNSFNSAQMKLLNGQPVWWVDTTQGNVGVRDKTDMQLYTSPDSTSATGPVPFVECASCHDPHSATPIFLRVSNTNSAVCLACHNI